LVSPLKGQYQGLVQQLPKTREQLDMYLIQLEAHTYPLRTGAGGENRLFSLLTWDTWAFAGCLCMFLYMMFLAECATAIRTEPCAHPARAAADPCRC
jgi:hypothetical protein